jgi:hypothetical protein
MIKPSSNRRQAVRRRDVGVERLGSLTRWVTVGAFGLAGALSAAVAAQYPGHAKPATAASSSPSGAAPAATTPPTTGTSSGAGSTSGAGLQSPSTAPTATAPPATPAPITSGGS